MIVRPTFQPVIFNDPFGDPGLWVNLDWGRGAIMFDLGDPRHLSSRQLHLVRQAFVTHAHVDHLIGFDHLLRHCLHRPEPLEIYGPRGFIDRITGKLSGYSWNLLERSPFEIRIHEVSGDRVATAVFSARSGFYRIADESRSWTDPDLSLGVGFKISAIELDHNIPCLAYRFQERDAISFDRIALKRMKLPTGRWMDIARKLIWEGADRKETVELETENGRRQMSLGWIESNLVRAKAPLSFAYVTDLRWSAANIARLIPFIQQCHTLYCEAMFLDQHADRALDRGHLTARQAGRIAGLARVTRLIPFHFSSKYLGQRERLEREAQSAFRQTKVNRPRSDLSGSVGNVR